MLKNKIDEYVEYFSFTLAMTEDEIRVLRAGLVDIVREAVGEMIGEEKGTKQIKRISDNQFLQEVAGVYGHNQRIEEEKAKAEEILNQLK
jgi:hypothetical protein